jgi:hypothetical protein
MAALVGMQRLARRERHKTEDACDRDKAYEGNISQVSCSYSNAASRVVAFVWIIDRVTP